VVRIPRIRANVPLDPRGAARENERAARDREGGAGMNAIAEAAKKRAAKLGIQNVEVDETNAGKTEDPGDLSHPFFGKLKGGAAGGLSPRSKRLAEMNKENEGDDGGAAEKKAAPAPPPAPAAPPAPPPAARPAAPPAPPAKQVNLGAGWSEVAAAELKAAVEGGQQQQHKDGLAVIKRWAGR